jgi:SET domain-containing protein
VLDYLGFYHTAEESDPKSDYDISLDRESGVSIDAQSMGNEGRFVNDYRGVPGKERPNVEFETRRVGGKGDADGQLRMGIWVLSKEIKKGEELLVSYGKGFWEGRKAE